MPELNNRPIVKYLDPKTGEYEYATVIDVGDLQLLNTQVKSDLVQAINSLFYDDRIGGGGSGELTPEDLERLKNIQASIDSIKDGTFEIVNFGSINTYLNQEMNAKYEELIERLNQSNREMYDTSLIDIQAAVDAATLTYEQKVAEQNALLDGAEKTLTDTKLALEETAKKLETADINYKSVKQTVDELNAYIEDEIKVIDMDNFNSMVSDYKTAVTQTKDRYGVEASKQTLSYLTGQVADAQAQINVQAGEIELRAKTDQLQYIPAKKESNANPNLLFETIELLSSHWNKEYGAMVTPNTFRYGKIGEFTSTNSKFTTVSDTLEIGETYTFSLYTNEQPLSKSPTDEKFAPTEDSFTPDDLTVIVDGKAVTMAIFEDLSSINGWCGVSGQFVATKENATISILPSGLEQTTHVGYISQPKLEKGLKVTPFISHVDDEIATVSTAFSLIKSQGDTILLQTQKVSQIGEENDALKETVAGIQIESGKITTAVSELEKKTEGEISRVEGKIETESNRIALEVSNKTTDEKLSALNMDTRNRIVNSDFELSEYVEKTKNWNYHGWSTIVSDIFTVLELDSTNYLIADKTKTSSNLNNSVWMRSTPFEIQTGKKMNVQAEVFIASNPDNYQVIEIELFDDKNTLLSTVPINVSQYTSNILRTVNVKNVPYNVFRVNFSTKIETEGVYKAQLKLGLRSGRGKVGFTKIMLNTSNMSEVDWSPAEEDNRIVQTKLESKIEILEDSITLMSEDERLDVLSGLLVQESGTFKISPQSILQEVTSTELGDSALVTKTFMNQTADGWKQGLVSKDGIIQSINASEEEYLIAFDKVRVDGSLEAKHFMGNALTLSDGFKIADKDGNAVLMANNDGQVVMNVSKLEINARPVATKDDVEEKINNIQLTPGPQGVSVNGVTEYYLATNSSSGVTTSTDGWSTSIPTIDATKQYLWNYEITSFSNGSKSAPTTPVIIGRYGLNGNNGVSITNVINYYALSNDKNVAPTSDWDTSPLLTSPTNRYLWNYEEIIYSNNKKTTTPKAVIGTHGESGSDGLPGKDGFGIKSTVIAYGLSTSENTQPSSWSDEVPPLTKGRYLWTKTEWTYTDDSKEVGYSKTYIAKDGNDGNNGLPGKDGVGIKSTSFHYGKSTSGTSHSGVTWLDAVPSVPNGQYLWTRTIWTYDDNTTEAGYSVAKMGETGPQGKQGIQGNKGADGKSSYTHIAYATGDQGQSFNHSTFPQATHIGVYVSDNQNSSDNWKDYKWTLIKGANGARGLPGAKGEDGRTPYFHTAYANSADGKVDFSITDSDKKKYIGTATTYSDTNPSGDDPTDPSKYKWVDMVGSVEVGGTNLLTGTSKEEQEVEAASWGIGYWNPSLIIGEEYTFSFDIKSENATYLQSVFLNASNNGFAPNTPISKKWTRVSFTFKWNGDEYLGREFAPHIYPKPDYSGTYVSRIKLEKGNIATDWSPAPEDIQSQIDKSIKSTDVEYYLSTSSTSLSGGSWQTTAPEWKNGKYMWSRTKVVLNDGTTQYRPNANGVNISGAKGDTGATGNGISSITEEYYLSTSKTTQTGGSWVATPPTWENGKYIWTRSKFVYTNSSTPKYTDPIVSSEWEAVNDLVIGGTNLLNGTSADFVERTITTRAYFYTMFELDDFANYGLKVGDELTLSMELDAPSGVQVRARFEQYLNDNLRNSFLGNIINSTTGVSSVTFRVMSDRPKFRVGIQPNPSPTTTSFKFKCRKIKLERGSKATDWAPSPQDIQNNIDNIQVGGRNLLLNSNKVSSLGVERKVGNQAFYDIPYSKWDNNYQVNLEKDETYTLSVPVYNNNNENLSSYISTTFNIRDNSVIHAKSTSKHVFTFTPTETVVGGTIYILTQNNTNNLSLSYGTAKLEIGNKPTDWTPAPEDVQANIDNIQVGGRNLLKGTSNSFEDISYNGIWWKAFPNMHKIPLSELGLSVGDEVVFSGILKATDTSAWLRLTMFWNETDYTNASGNKIAAGKTGLSEIKVTIPANTKYISFAFDFGSAGTKGTTISYKELKFERGNKRTDWTPAPEDVENALGSKANANEVDDNFKAMIESLNDKASTEALNKLREEYQNYTQTSDANKKQVAENIEKLLGREKSINTTLGELSVSWTALTKQMVFGEEGLTIGDVTTGSYVLVDANQIAFYSNGSVTATIKDGNFEFIDGVITNSFRTLNLQMVQGNKANHVSFRLV